MTDSDTKSTTSRKTEHENGDQFQVAFDPQQQSATEILIHAVASVTDRRLDQIPILNDYIDPDALDVLFRPTGDELASGPDQSIFFRYAECDVRIDAGGAMTLSFDTKV
ncbi:HalOD1 output domain-containing protein [Haloferax sp. DFSO60]|uniref:HalOD1 output domain-containing protein n=1 Tax=Haloferax sp. DFSO60 TaxID=3388652 RepID=UPI00397B2849